MIYTLVYSSALNSNLSNYFLVLAISLSSVACLSGATVMKYPLQLETESVENPLMHETDTSSTASFKSEEDSSVSGPSNPSLFSPSGTRLAQVASSGESTILNEDEVSGFRLLLRVDFWVLFFIFFFVTGSGLMWKNVVGSICDSYDDISSGTKDYLVICWSLTSSCTRIIAGVTSDHARNRVPRPVFFVIGTSIMLLTHFLYIVLKEDSLWIVTVGTGIGYGVLWSIHPTITSLYYGMKHLSRNLSILGFAPAFSGLMYTALSSPLSGNHYENLFILSCVGLIIAIVLEIWLSYTFDMTRELEYKERR